MTSTTRDISYALRQGQLIAIADETGWSLAVDPLNDTAVEKLLQVQQQTDADLTLVIQNADQLVMYVVKLPEVAWDLIEFAENPLIVLFEQGKNISKLVDPTAEIAIRKSLNPEIQRLIGGFGKGLLTLSFESLALPAPAEIAAQARFGVLPTKAKRPRILRLGINGEIEFIRR
jgi:L-threonylcarbamoyladenylate synthase